MNSPKERSHIQFTERSFPAAALILLSLTFGVMFPLLGLYWDDWPVIAAAKLKGVGSFWEFYAGERPFSAWTYIVTIPFIGTNPFLWHIFTLVMRWLSVVAMWWALIGLWPKRLREVTWIALLFAIYPVFTQQPVAVAFNQHWINFALFFVSFGAMIYSFRKPRWFWLFLTIALVTELLHVLTMEYFWGLELLRPIVLFFLFGEQSQRIKERLSKTLVGWLPYLLILVVALVLRMTLFVNPVKDPNRPDLLYGLKEQPLSTLVRLAQLAIQDFINNLFSTWYSTFSAKDINLQDQFFWISILMAIMVALLTYFYISHWSERDVRSSHYEDKDTWLRQALVIGLAGAMLGPLPVWLSDRQVLWGIYGGRFGLAAELGVSILFIALLEWLTIKYRYKLLILAVLIGLSSGYHIRNSAVFHQAKIKQQQFFWQLYWRAPYLKPQTAILSADELFPNVGRYATSLIFNLLYPQTDKRDEMDYWFIELSYDIAPKNIPNVVSGMDFNRSFRNFQFQGTSKNSLVIYYKSGTGRCLWVLAEDDFDRPGVPDLTQQVVSISSLERIDAQPLQEGYPDTQLFGREPVHDWCYYYQKGDLARQIGDWAEIVRLGNEAQQKGYFPQDATEWFPFIEGFGMQADWEKALSLSRSALESKPALAPGLCRLWQRIANYHSLEDIRPAINQLLPTGQCLLP